MNNIIGMFRGSKNSLESGGISAADTTDDLIRCPDCKCFESRKAIAKNKAVCANCGHHFRVSARNRIVMIADRDTFTEHDASVTSCDPLDFPGYRDKLERAKDLLRHAGTVRTREQLLNNVWGYSFEGYARTVDTHVRRLRSKLGEAAATLETVRGVGYSADAS